MSGQPRWSTSIAKKEIMALTGLGLVTFLVAHLAGNLSIMGGSEAFNGYASKLESLGPLVLVFEAGLLAVAGAHIVVALVLTVQNFRARGRRYAVKKPEGGRSWASRTMWLTGPWTLAFIVLHLTHFTFPYKFGEGVALSSLVAGLLAQPWWTAYYVVSVAMVGVHVSHGVWSAIQTLGLGPLRRGALRELTLMLGVAFALGFGYIAAYVYWIPNLLR